jgi:geranylgeranyl reductase family protein
MKKLIIRKFMFDVIISGAGPSGSQSAELLAKAGFKVALIEKNTKWRKPCGGALNHRVLDMYPKLRKLNLPKIRTIVMHSAEYYRLEYKAPEQSRGTIMDRLELDNFVRDMAIEAGAKLFDKNLSYDFITKNQKKIGIKTKSPSGTKEYYGRVIVVADGMSSKLAIKSGIRDKWKVEELANGKCAIMEGKHHLDEESIYIYFKPFKGYAWIFPLDEKCFNIGVYTFSEDNLNYNLNRVYDDFIKNSRIQPLLGNSKNKLHWLGSYPFPVNGILENNLIDDHLMLVGDTGGFVSPISGEGIQHAMLSGKIAAETAINALEIEDFSKNTLKKYKNHPQIKKQVRSFKLKNSLREFFYKDDGKYLNKIFKLAESNPEFRSQVVDIFMSKSVPSKDFLSKIQ